MASPVSRLPGLLNIFKYNLLRTVGSIAVEQVKPATKAVSKTLAASTKAVIIKRPSGKTFGPKVGVVCVWVPHYWARWQHEGRKGINAEKVQVTIGRGKYKGKKYEAYRSLVWYKDPSQDPRFKTRPWPIQRTDWRHLTPGEFQKDRAEGKLVFAWAVGPVAARPFFRGPLTRPMFHYRMRIRVRSRLTEFLKKHVVVHDRKAAIVKL